MTFSQKQFEDVVKANGQSPEHIELLLSVNKFLASSKSALDVLAAMAQVVAISAVGISHQEDFIHEISNQAVHAVRFANAMSKAMEGGDNEPHH